MPDDVTADGRGEVLFLFGLLFVFLFLFLLSLRLFFGFLIGLDVGQGDGHIVVTAGREGSRDQLVFALNRVFVELDHRVEDHVIVTDATETVTAEHDDVAVVQLIDACLGFCTAVNVAQTTGDDV